jgi:glycosyltransferase involved in cell wall biosynthesis
MSRQTILFLASWFPTPQNKNHGIFIKNHAIALSKYIPVIVVYAYSSSKAKHPEIFKNKQGNYEEWLLEYKKTSDVPILSSVIKFFHFKSAYKKLLNELISNNVLIKSIQLNTIFPAAVILPMFKKHFKVPYTIVEHWSGYLAEDGSYKTIFQKAITKKITRNASKIYYVSEKQKEAMLSHNLIGNYELLYNAVDTDVFFNIKKTEKKEPTFLHVSSLVEKEKNIIGTLHVMRKLQAKNYNFQFIIVGGTTTNVDFYKTEAERMGLENILFVGEKTQQEVSKYMQNADALILFSNYEGMPVVVLEALATGLPVFASNVGQLPNIINNDFGRLVPVNNESALEKYLEEFLNTNLKFDSDKMTEFIHKTASKEAVGKKLANYYTDVCSSIKFVNSTN